MERLRGGLRKGSAAAVTYKPGVAPSKGKFKLCTSRDPMPLVSKKQPSWETKPKVKFLTAVAGAGASTEKKNNTKPSMFTTKRFSREPVMKDGTPPKKSSVFSFTKFQSKLRDPGASSRESSVKATPQALASIKPLLSKFSAKKRSNEINTDNETLFKPQLFAFRADTKSSYAKKRKAADAIAHGDGKTAFSCKNERENPATSKDKGKQSGARVEKAGRKDGMRSSMPFAIKMDEMGMKVNNGAVLKKRGSLLAPAIEGPALKKSKPFPPTELHPLQNTGVVESRSSSRDTIQSDRVSLPRTSMLNPKETPLEFAADTVLSSAVPPERVNEELAVKRVCTADGDKEDEFLARVAAIQEFTDRVGLEQKHLCSRLLDTHADISASLLDALTDLMAEEGGIGIDKLDFDLNIDVDVGDIFLQDDEIRVFQ